MQLGRSMVANKKKDWGIIQLRHYSIGLALAPSTINTLDS